MPYVGMCQIWVPLLFPEGIVIADYVFVKLVKDILLLQFCEYSHVMMHQFGELLNVSYENLGC